MLPKTIQIINNGCDTAPGNIVAFKSSPNSTSTYVAVELGCNKKNKGAKTNISARRTDSSRGPHQGMNNAPFTK